MLLCSSSGFVPFSLFSALCSAGFFLMLSDQALVITHQGASFMWPLNFATLLNEAR